SFSVLSEPSSCSPTTATGRCSWRAEQNAIFDAERLRQHHLAGKVEKIKVNVKPCPAEDEHALILNKGISTPYDCAKHINEQFMISAALALVDGKLWDMHRPLVSDCSLKFLYFTDENPYFVNRAYWRTCSLVLGYILETSFEENVQVTLHSWPGTNYRTGSFVYDVRIDCDGFQLSDQDLRILSLMPLQQLRSQRLMFERLEVSLDVAKQLFKHNEFKFQQLPSIERSSLTEDGRIPLYRFGDHIDVSRGPMVSHTQQLGYYEICSVSILHRASDAGVTFTPLQYSAEDTDDFGQLYRFQGVSVPYTQRINSWTWEVLKRFSKRKNSMPLPSLQRYATNASSDAAGKNVSAAVSSLPNNY
ncbi:unnamed protein product, partial [Soboliphyme baturini]|uniref:TGS domain-containing protein n=1 Tax=Soboliphyme baturini TaxID=241478 RepID=A0A183ICP4_9BILA